MKRYYKPRKMELILTAVIIIIAALSTSIIFPAIISTDKLPLWVIIIMFIGIFLIFAVGIEYTFDCFYSSWMKRKKKIK